VATIIAGLMPATGLSVLSPLDEIGFRSVSRIYQTGPKPVSNL